MGLTISRVFSRLFEKKQVKILMLGLDAAGKTTILYKLKLGDIITATPTVGFNVESVEYRNISFTVWDVGGQDKIRQLWKFYFDNVEGLIFVVDCNDENRIEEAAKELKSILKEPKLSQAVLLVFANKQDLPNAVTSFQLIEILGLNKLSHRQWHVQSSIAPKNIGLYEGLDWLSDQLSKK